MKRINLKGETVTAYLEYMLRTGVIKNGYEIQESDIGGLLSLGWGRILPVDVGKRVYYRDSIFQMENSEQRDKRINKTNSVR